MSRQTLTVQSVVRGGLLATFSNGHADGHAFANDGAMLLSVKNSTATLKQVLLRIPRTVDGKAVPSIPISFAAGDSTVQEKFIGPFPTSIYNQGGSLGDNAYVDEVGGTYGVGTLTLSGGLTVSNDETVTIGSGPDARVYTFKTVLTGAANEVLIGATPAIALDNLKSAINGTSGEGTTYGTGTKPNPLVEATTNTDTTQIIQSRLIGTVGNIIVTTEAMTNGAWGAGVLASGTDDVVTGLTLAALSIAGG